MPHDESRQTGALPRLSRAQMARIVAHDIPDGSIVNLGIGMPTLVSDQLPSDREIVLHSENGILGMGASSSPHCRPTTVVRVSTPG